MKKSLTALGLFAAVLALFSFAAIRGGEGFEISLDGKILLQRYNKEVNEVKTISLPVIAAGTELSVRYHHCGRVGKNRVIRIKDNENRMLNEFSFPDGNATPMQLKVKSLETSSKSPYLKLYYSSNEIPEGRLLAFIAAGGSRIVTP